MVQEKGQVTASGEAWLYVSLQDGQAVECLLDTGFNGWLSWSREIVNRLALPLIGKETVETLGGVKQICSIAAADIVWLGLKRTIPVLVNEGTDTLVGTQLLTKTILRINYYNAKVTITKTHK